MLNFTNQPLPCKDCPRSGCGSYHDECQELQTALAERRQLMEKIRQQNYVDNYIRESVSNAKRRANKKRGKLYD